MNQLQLLSLLLIETLTESTVEFYVSQGPGGCEAECAPKGTLPGRPCCNLELIAENYSQPDSNITLYLSGSIDVSSLVSFTDIFNLYLKGSSEQKALLNCNSSSHSSAGFQFIDVHSLVISNVRFKGCGANYSINGRNLTSALVIASCSDIMLDDIVISESRQNSLILENPIRNATLRNIAVQDNLQRRDSEVEAGTSFAGGIKIIVLSFSSFVRISNCHFSNVTTPDYIEYDPRKTDGIKNWLGFGLGGGLSIILEKNSSNNEISVDQCTFEDNHAPFGACLYIRFQDTARENFVIINNSSFRRCNARWGGGGLAVGIAREEIRNKLHVNNSQFQNNTAIFGGGTYLFGFHSHTLSQNDSFIFTDCKWIGNFGRYSPAVDVSPSRFDHHGNGLLPTPVFCDCTFIDNRNMHYITSNGRSISSGVFVVTLLTVRLQGRFAFRNNRYTALLINSARVVVEENSEVEFSNNEGFYGGAVALHGFATLSMSDHSTFSFINNSATENGGGIFYHTIEQREFFASRSCFLEYSGPRTIPVSNRNITVVFRGNSAKQGGSSIFASTFFSCFFSTRAGRTNNSLPSFLDDIGNFTFDENKSDSHLSTTGYLFNESETLTLPVWPGMEVYLPLRIRDEFSNILESEFNVQMEGSSDSYSRYPYTVNKSVTLLGNENDNASLIVSTQHVYRIVQYNLSVEFLKCPPGFFHANSSCHCTVGSASAKFYGILRCNYTDYSAIIAGGYWFGEKAGEYYTGACSQFCATSQEENALPNSTEALNSTICGSSRTGVLCGQCMDGYSTYYHSKNFTCGKEDLCSYGILLFIVSELLPVLILFTVSVIFDVSFSSGYSNGLVFYSQMVIILPFRPLSSLPMDRFMNLLENGYLFVYGIFSLEFFPIEELSFCLFKGATLMDVLAFKYITITLALILVVLLVVFIKYCTCCSNICVAFRKKVTSKVSILHGLSAFLVVCFAECTRVSFFILRRTSLYGSGGQLGPRVTYYGGIDYLGDKHLMYIIPAILFLCVISIFPLLLLLFPLVLQVLQLCKLSESRPVLFVLKLTRFHALMPVFDIFQGCFKDRFRFFAGLYFFHRVAILTPYSFSNNYLYYAVTSELVFFLILGIHSVAQPYKQRRHNVIDSLLFSNLIIVNGLGIVATELVTNRQNIISMIEIAVYLQLLFIYLPIIIIAIFLLVKLCISVKRLLKKQSESKCDNEFLKHLDSIDRSMEEDTELNDFSSGYRQDSNSEFEINTQD